MARRQGPRGRRRLRFECVGRGRSQRRRRDKNSLAGALRINPASPIAKAAFARMEGLDGDFSALEAAMQQWTADALSKLEREMSQPSFNRAQVGFNNNVKYKEHVYHIQTEDSGLNKPHIITHLFADGGRIIKSHKRSYANDVSRPDVTMFVRALMKGQQMEMIISLRDGKFDEIIEGRAVGGMETLTEAPSVDIKQIKEPSPASRSPRANRFRRASTSQAMRAVSPSVASGMRVATADSSAAAAIPVTVQARNPNLIPASERAAAVARKTDAARAARGSRSRSARASAEASVSPSRSSQHVGRTRCLRAARRRSDLGREGGITLVGEKFCHPSEAVLKWKNGALLIEDFDGGNGVFLRVRRPVEVEPGDEFIIGDQLLRIMKNPVADDEPDTDPTYFYSSPKWPSAFRVVQIFEGGAFGASVVARGTTLQVGSAVGDLVFPNDALVSEQHCYIEEQAGSIVLTDLQSRTGVFVRVKSEERLDHGDQIIVGRTRLAVDLSPSGLG